MTLSGAPASSTPPSQSPPHGQQITQQHGAAERAPPRSTSHSGHSIAAEQRSQQLQHQPSSSAHSAGGRPAAPRAPRDDETARAANYPRLESDLGRVGNRNVGGGDASRRSRSRSRSRAWPAVAASLPGAPAPRAKERRSFSAPGANGDGSSAESSVVHVPSGSPAAAPEVHRVQSSSDAGASSSSRRSSAQMELTPDVGTAARS